MKNYGIYNGLLYTNSGELLSKKRLKSNKESAFLLGTKVILNPKAQAIVKYNALIRSLKIYNKWSDNLGGY
jgi:hypothetical protein